MTNEIYNSISNHTTQPDVFISYHVTSSSHIAADIAQQLESRNISCWYAPRDIDTTKSYASSIVKAIEECKIFLLLITEQAMNSAHILNELDIAFRRCITKENCIVIPFKLCEQNLTIEFQYYLGKMQILDGTIPPVQNRIEELVDRISSILNASNQSRERTYELHGVTLYPTRGFMGRKDDKEDLDTLLKDERIVFVTGETGIGKTELVKSYLKDNGKNFDQVLFYNFKSSLEELLNNDNEVSIQNFESQKEGESSHEYALRKLNCLKTIATDRTIIVLDHYVAPADPLFEEFLDGPYRVIITTELNFEHFGYRQIKVRSLSEIKQEMLFSNYYKRKLDKDNLTCVKRILSCMNGNTLEIVRTANTMFKRRISPEKMLKQIKENGAEMPVDVFISYHTNSSQTIAVTLCNKIEENGMRCWYAPRDVEQGNYASCIVDAIKECKFFVVILNREASYSEDVLNEINIAVKRQRKGENIEILPLQITDEEFSSDAEYYLSRKHWFDAVNVPLVTGINNLVEEIKSKLSIGE